jgi:hypothetical protein
VVVTVPKAPTVPPKVVKPVPITVPKKPAVVVTVKKVNTGVTTTKTTRATPASARKPPAAVVTAPHPASPSVGTPAKPWPGQPLQSVRAVAGFAARMGRFV